MKNLAAALLVIGAVSVAHAETTCPEGQTAGADGTCADDDKRDEDNGPFSHWGIGPAITYDAFNRGEVDNVRVDNGIVRGDTQANADVGLVFELHYMVERESLLPFGPANTGLCGGRSRCGSGPFIAAQAGTDNIIESLGGGWMWGFRREGDERPWGASQFNFGIGVMIDPTNEVLDDGFMLNAPLPAGETAVRTHTDAQAEFVLVLSVSP